MIHAAVLTEGDQLAGLATLHIAQDDAFAGLDVDHEALAASDHVALDAGRQSAHARAQDAAPGRRQRRCDRRRGPIQHVRIPVRAPARP